MTSRLLATAPSSAATRRPEVVALVLIVIAGAVLRFSTLGLQHFWIDEATTAAIVRLPLGEVLDAVRLFESNPPLYYLLSWAWGQVAGTSEVALRVIPAMAGTATIPLVYAATAAVASRRAAVFAAALVAVSPMLVWYSQENRVYALLIPLAAATVLFWLRALRGEGGMSALLGWVVAGALALLTHYFACFLVVPQALWLLRRLGPRRPVVLAVGAVGLAGVALLPLLLSQRRLSAGWVGTTPLPGRVRDTAEVFLTGTALTTAWIAAAAGLLALTAWMLARRADGDERRAALLLGALAACSLVIPSVLALAGLDYVISRNLVAAWVPAAMAAAIGVGAQAAGRAGAVVGAAMLLLALGLTLAVPLDRGLQREAITAGLSGGALDEERQRLVPAVTFAPARRGAARATCPAGYGAATGNALLLASSGRRQVAAAAIGPRTWEAPVPPRAGGDDVLLVYVVCAAPRAGAGDAASTRPPPSEPRKAATASSPSRTA